MPEIAPDDKVEWTYVVTNIGQTPLRNVQVVDDKLSALTPPVTPTFVSGDTNNDQVLDLTETWVFTATGIAQDLPNPDGATPACYVNIGSVTGQFGEQTVNDSDPSSYCNPPNPAIDIEKATNGPGQIPQDADTPTGPRITVGNEVVWNYVVRNIGDTDLRDVVVTDDKLDTISCPRNMLAINESMTCRATGTATVGQYENQSEVVGYSVYGNRKVDDSDPSHYIGILPSLDINKTVEASWTYHVTNTGEVTLTQVTVNGGPDVTVTCQDGALEIGASTICPAEGPLSRFANTARVTSRPEGFDVLLTKDIFAAPISGVSIQTELNGNRFLTFAPQEVVVNSTLKWSFEVRNNGINELERIAVTYMNLQTGESATADCPQETLAVDASMSCTAETIAAEGREGMVATVVGYPAGYNSSISDDTLNWVDGSSGASVGGRFFVDRFEQDGNPNGRQDPTETSFVNNELNVKLYRYNGTLVGSEQLASNESSTKGQYQFDNLTPDDYYLVFTRPIDPGSYFNWTLDNRGNDALDSDVIGQDEVSATARTYYFRLNAGQVDMRWDAGLQQVTLAGRIGTDDNNNVALDPEDGGVGGIQIKATLLIDGESPDPFLTTTDAKGGYIFEDLDPGRYQVEVVPSGGYKPLNPKPEPGTLDFIVVPDSGSLLTYLAIFMNR
ncbi:hypothetical protein KFU94_45785 [Chloroflexi bacterium TSY]|nr:hypothetical protein [Chloroflexi bacterium TSY]